MKTTLTSMLKLFGLALPALALLGLGFAGCESHYTTQDAYEACDKILSNAVDKDAVDVHADCVACHEDCGTDCNEEGTSPLSFTCPDEEGGSGGGSGSGGGESDETAE